MEPRGGVVVGQSTVLDLKLSSEATLSLDTGWAGSCLSLIDSVTYQRRELGWLDGAHPVPHVFRWSEIERVAAYLEAECEYPASPSLPLLLLAPFAAVTTTDDEHAATARLREELECLGLLSPSAIQAALKLLAPREPVWIEDESLGWRLEPNGAMSGVHSLRVPSNAEFPATQFLSLLRLAGVEDLPQ